jgi:hypothetical protein
MQEGGMTQVQILQQQLEFHESMAAQTQKQIEEV